MRTIYTWRVMSPFDRDTVDLTIIKCEIEGDGYEGSRAWWLELEPEPHWQEYGEGWMIGRTISVPGTEMIGWRPQTSDERERVETRLNVLVQQAMTALIEADNLFLPVEAEEG